MASHGRINFVAAKQKQISDKVASRTRIRGQVKNKLKWILKSGGSCEENEFLPNLDCLPLPLNNPALASN